jgi:hypothetical protein
MFLPVIFMQKHSTKPQGDKSGVEGMAVSSQVVNKL